MDKDGLATEAIEEWAASLPVEDGDDDWLTEEVLAEIDEAAKGPSKSFSSVDEMMEHLKH